MDSQPEKTAEEQPEHKEKVEKTETFRDFVSQFCEPPKRLSLPTGKVLLFSVKPEFQKRDKLDGLRDKALKADVRLQEKPLGVVIWDSDPRLLKTNPEYERLFPQLTQEEYSALKQSIQGQGQHYPIIVNSDYEILDGHHRYKACLDLGIEPNFEIRHFEDKLLERKFVIEVNRMRRQLKPLDFAKLGVEIERIEAERAKQRQLSTLKKGNIVPLVSNETNGQKGKVMDIAAKAIHHSPTTYYREKIILEKGSPELQDKVNKGEISVNKAFEQVQEKTVEAQAAEMFASGEKELKKGLRYIDKIVADLKPYYPELFVKAIYGSYALTGDKITSEKVASRANVLIAILHEQAVSSKKFDDYLEEASKWQ